MLTQKRLKQLFTYDKKTGVFNHLNMLTSRGKIKKQPGTISCGYHRIQIDGRRYMSHRLAFLYILGYLPENEVDHKDRNKLNNSFENLREVSRTCNTRNCSISVNNKSNVAGVNWHRATGMWTAQISNNNKKIYLGVYKEKVDAAKARWEAEKLFNYPNCNSSSTAYLYIKEERHLEGKKKK